MTSAIQHELVANDTGQDPEYLSMHAPNPSRQNLTTVAVNDVLPSTTTFSDIRETCNASYGSGKTTNIHMTRNEAYELDIDAIRATITNHVFAGISENNSEDI